MKLCAVKPLLKAATSLLQTVEICMKVVMNQALVSELVLTAGQAMARSLFLADSSDLALFTTIL